MKSVILTALFSALNAKFNFLPSPYLLLGIFFLVGLDFLTGILKAIVLNQPRTSKGYRETISKFIQYVGGIILSIFLSALIKNVPELVQLDFFSKYINNVILFFIIFIEMCSVLENLTAIDNKSLISKYCFQPLKNLLTFEFKNLIKQPNNEQIDSSSNTNNNNTH